jgi:hypothetical protein
MTTKKPQDIIIPFKTVLFNSLSDVCDYIKSRNIPQHRGVYCDIYSEKYAVMHEKLDNNMYRIRIWKTKVLFDWWYDDFNRSTFGAALDYSIYSGNVRIEYMSSNDDEFRDESTDIPILSKNNIFDLNKCLLDYVKMIAKCTCKKRVVIDVHEI